CELIALRADFRDLSQDALRAEAERLTRAVPEGWQHLFSLLIAHQSEWTMPAPAQLKQILDRDFPVQGYRFDDMVRGTEALGGSPTDEKTATEFMVSPLIHAAKWREGNAAWLCCEQRSSGWRQFDRVQYLDLMEALAAGELAGHLQFLTQAQGRPEAALHEADLYDQVHFHGLDPQIMAARI